MLTDQLEEINRRYEAKKRDRQDPFGLLHGTRKFLDWKEYRHSEAPEEKGLILVFFSDRILNLKAEEIQMTVHLQNKYQTLPFVLEAQNNFQRFNASQKCTLFKAIFEEEFDVDVLVQAKVILSHFMMHTHQKHEILASWKQHRFPLIAGILGITDLMAHIEPILLIAEYYGEKQAFYFTFLIHHIGMLFIPAITGIPLIAWHFHRATEYEPTEEEADTFLTNYFASLDTKMNYPYLLLLAIWSTVYIESWKRK